MKVFRWLRVIGHTIFGNADVEIFTPVEIARWQESWPDGRHSRCPQP